MALNLQTWRSAKLQGFMIIMIQGFKIEDCVAEL